MNRKIEIAISATFICAAVVAGINIWRLNDYVRETVIRDTAQEQCARDTLDTLQIWVITREELNEKSLAQNDAMSRIVINIHEGKPIPESDWHDFLSAIAETQKVRQEIRVMADEHPLPVC